MDTCKICILGDFAVGKTSLVARFVHNQFSNQYHTSVGIKVDTKELIVPDGCYLKLAIWDVAGTDTPTELFLRYLRGSSGYVLVADCTRRKTFERALQLRDAVESQMEGLPFVGLVNKVDLASEQEIDEACLSRHREAGDVWIRTSALSGEHVEDAFHLLIRAIKVQA